MDSHDLLRMLERVRDGDVEPQEALQQLRWKAPYPDAEMGEFAKVDLHRRIRCGFPEVIFGQGKTPEQVTSILRTLIEHGEGALATRITTEIAAVLCKTFPEGRYNALARTFQIPAPTQPGPPLGRVAVVTAGTSDLPVAEEARVTARAWNCQVDLIADVGVAGIHRLLRRLEALQGADALVAVAGMEGALPSVVGGLVDCPVIAVPTSIGYGAQLHGLSPLLTMLNSCASNVVVVNIDAGFNGGYVAGLIARRAGQSRASAQESGGDGTHHGSAPAEAS